MALIALCFGNATARGQGCELTETLESYGGNSSSGDQFGNAVAATDEFVVVGAYLEDAMGLDSGAAYVFIEPTLVQYAHLVAADGTPGDQFGFSVAAHANTIVVGAPKDDVAGTDSGSAYVFRRLGNNWFQVAKLTPSDASQSSQFGLSVAISGPTIVVGSAKGRAYVFDEQVGVWSETTTLTASDGSDPSFSASLSIDGDVVVVGESGDDDISANSGAVFVFERVFGIFIELAKLKSPSPQADDRLGSAVSVSGSTILAGAYRADGFVTDSGAAFVFLKAAGQWTYNAKLSASDGLANDDVGSDVAILGNRAVVGARFHGPGAVGAAYVFAKSPTGWSETHKCLSSTPVLGSGIGSAVAITSDHVFLGSRSDDDVGLDAGSILSFRSSPQSAFSAYGIGCGGSGGFVPTLQMSGCPISGGSATLSIANALGGSTALLLFGATETTVPIGITGCDLLISPVLPASLSLPILGSGPGNGFITVTAGIPQNSAGAFTIQAFVAEPSIHLGFAVTNGVSVEFQ